MVEDYKNKSGELIVREIDGIIYTERWATIKQFPKYSISSFGRTKRNQRMNFNRTRILPEKIFSLRLNKKGYVVFNFAGYAKKRAFVHRLVGFAFIPLVEGKNCINHKTGIKTDNHYSQLEWCTVEENNQHAKENNLLRCKPSKLSEADRAYIKEHISATNREELAEKFDISIDMVYDIGTNRDGRGEKKSIRQIGRKAAPVRYKKMINVSTGEIFESALDLSKKSGITVKNLRRYASGERPNPTPYRYVGQENLIKEKPIIKVPKNPFAVFDMNWNYITRFDYTKDLALFLNQKNTSAVNAFMSGKCQFVKGYKFKKINEDGSYTDPLPFISKKPPLKPKLIRGPVTPSKKIFKINQEGSVVAEFNSIGDAARSAGIEKRTFRGAIRKSPRNYYKGFIWKIID